MKTSHFLVLLSLLPASAVSAQSHEKAASTHKVQKKPVTIEPQPEELQVGDTCYVTSKALHLRSSPDADYRPHLAFEHGKDLIVREVTNNKWILIVSYDIDVGVVGYVSRKYVSKTKPK